MNSKWVWAVLVSAAFATLVLTFLLGIALFSGRDTGTFHGDGVGLVEVKGMILDSQEIVKQLHELKKNDHVKSVVVRIDSPGGVVGPSQEIHDEILKLTRQKKVVVSMGSLAASGGYYVAAPATVIYSNPGTITGSIGVLMKFSNTEKLMDKIGLRMFTLKTGQFKDAGSPARPMTDEEKAMLQGVIESAHSQFIRAVAEGRKLPLEEVRKIADGRIFTGEQALALKLVDRLGTLQDAIEEAGRLGGIKGDPEVIRPPKKKKLLLDMLVEETAAGITNLVRQEGGLSAVYSP